MKSELDALKRLVAGLVNFGLLLYAPIASIVFGTVRKLPLAEEDDTQRTAEKEERDRPDTFHMFR